MWSRDTDDNGKVVVGNVNKKKQINKNLSIDSDLYIYYLHHLAKIICFACFNLLNVNSNKNGLIYYLYKRFVYCL